MSEADRAHALRDAAKSLLDLCESNLRTFQITGERWQAFEHCAPEHVERLRKLLGAA